MLHCRRIVVGVTEVALGSLEGLTARGKISTSKFSLLLLICILCFISGEFYVVFNVQVSHSVSIIESKHKGPFIFYRVGVGQWLDMITNLILRFEGRLYLQPNSRRGWFVLFGAQ